MSTYIEIKKYGDYDMVYTDCIMVSKKRFKRLELLKEFESTSGHELDGNKYTELDLVADLFKEFLIDKGFTKLKTFGVLFGD